jgi:thiol-disulfide isomerase/thioredoxin
MTDKIPEIPPSRAGQAGTLRLLLIAAVLGAAAGLAAVYGIGGLERNGTDLAADPACMGAVDTAKRLAPLARGEVAALRLSTSPGRIPELQFKDGNGKAMRLADFSGRTVLLNLWATWCVPCRKEIPALDALERTLGGNAFKVVAVNLDTGDPAKGRRFLAEIGVGKLAYYEDPTTNVFQELKRVGRAPGLPISLLVDANGCEIGYLAGPAEWSSADALALVKAAIAR